MNEEAEDHLIDALEGCERCKGMEVWLKVNTENEYSGVIVVCQNCHREILIDDISMKDDK